MSAISEYEGSKILEFFKHHPDNEKKLISIAKTITKNTLTHLCLNGKIIKFKIVEITESDINSNFRRLQDRFAAF